jgi:hypothetical protein
MNRLIRFTLVTLATVALAIPVAAQQADHPAAPNPLVQLLQSKGILTAEEAANIGTASTPGEANERLAHLLLNKGLISQEEYNATAAASAVPVASAQAAPGGARMVNAAAAAAPSAAPIAPSSSPAPVKKREALWPVSPNMVGYDPSDGASADAQTIPAIAPVRLLSIGIPKDPKGIIPDIKLGSGAMINPYGFFKASAVYDTTNSGGPTLGNNDFPLPLLQSGDTGPDAGSQMRFKARSARFGANVFYPINGPDITLTGKIEFDWEGDYETANNRNISSIRSPQASLRLAWARMDAKIGGVPWFAEFGQDWTLLGSSTVMDLFESTGFGVFFGNFYERIPQFKTGMQFSAGDVKIEPEVAVTLGAFGDANLNSSINSALLTNLNQVQAGFQNQTKEGAFLGPDSGQPGVEGRIVIDFPMNKDWKGVPNAELIVSGGHNEGREIVPFGNIPNTPVAGLTTPNSVCTAPTVANPCSVRSYYPRGLTMDIPQNAFSGEFQLPTPWFTLVGKYYRGSDLRFMFGGQLNSVFADTLGIAPISIPGTTLLCTGGTQGCPATGAGAGTISVTQPVTALNGDTISFINPGTGCTGATPTNCVAQVAKLRPVRGYGALVQLGIPLSRIFGANPEGLNRGWTLFMGYGMDGAVNRDAARTITASSTTLAGGNGLRRSDYVPISLRYQMNKWASFVNEVTWYDTRTGTRRGTNTNVFVLFRGIDAKINHDIREEFGTIFTF